MCPYNLSTFSILSASKAVFEKTHQEDVEESAFLQNFCTFMSSDVQITVENSTLLSVYLSRNLTVSFYTVKKQL